MTTVQSIRVAIKILTEKSVRAKQAAQDMNVIGDIATRQGRNFLSGQDPVRDEELVAKIRNIAASVREAQQKLAQEEENQRDALGIPRSVNKSEIGNYRKIFQELETPEILQLINLLNELNNNQYCSSAISAENAARISPLMVKLTLIQDQAQICTRGAFIVMLAGIIAERAKS